MKSKPTNSKTCLSQSDQKLLSKYPKFSDGRVDYTNKRICYCLNCTAICDDEVLLTLRSEDVMAYPNTINGISGFIDQPSLSINETARIELDEELCAPKDAKITVGKMLIQVDEELNREWRVFPVLVEFDKKFIPKTNWENKTAKWYKINDVKNLKLMPGFLATFSVALRLQKDAK